MEAVILTSVIYFAEKKNVVITDISGAYLTIEINEEMLMILGEKMLELIFITKLEIYRTFMTIGKSSKYIFYMKLKKALFGFLRSSLLF